MRPREYGGASTRSLTRAKGGFAKRYQGSSCRFSCARSKKQAELQAHVDHKNLSFKVSMVTGPSGSYKEEDMIVFLEQWLEPWGPGREWGFLLLDAYAPCLTDDVQRLCWSRGYISIPTVVGLL